jgi:MFS transporter, PAT family, beta-lactamase induction signal transducer AmpG
MFFATAIIKIKTVFIHKVPVMTTQRPYQYTFGQQFKLYVQPPVVNMLFLGFSAGLPILLIFSSLSLWLREAGVSRSMVTYFSWAALGYSFKLIWAPLVDQLPLPFLNKYLGKRRGWLLLSQMMVACSIVAMAMTDPQQGQQALTVMAISAVALGFSSATQDVVIDAYRIEIADADLQALMSATYIAGYRIAMIVAGAGALFLAADWGSSMESYDYNAWKKSYLVMAAMMLIGMKTTLFIKEPESPQKTIDYKSKDYLRFLVLFFCIVSVFVFGYIVQGPQVSWLKETLLAWTGNKPLASTLSECLRLLFSVGLSAIAAKWMLALGLAKKQLVVDAYVAPIQDFFSRYGLKLALLLLVLIGFYRISDIVLGVIANVFYQDMGFSKKEIAGVVKTFGVVMTILGGFLGGSFAIRYGVMKALFLGAILSSVTNLLFMFLPTVLKMENISEFSFGFECFYPSWGITVVVALCAIGLGLYRHVKNTEDRGLQKKMIFIMVEIGIALVALCLALLLGFLSIESFSLVQSNFNFSGELLSLGIVISADNLSAGIASAAFIAFLSSLTNVSFTATQFAIFSSMMTLLPKIFGGYSGSIVESFGYERFFLITTIIGLPVLLLVFLASRKLSLAEL